MIAVDNSTMGEQLEQNAREAGQMIKNIFGAGDSTNDQSNYGFMDGCFDLIVIGGIVIGVAELAIYLRNGGERNGLNDWQKESCCCAPIKEESDDEREKSKKDKKKKERKPPATSMTTAAADDVEEEEEGGIEYK